MLGDTDPAEDVAQEVFLKVHARLSQFRFESRFEAWLHRIAARTAVDHTRRFWFRRRVTFDVLPEPRREAALSGAGGNPRHAARETDPERRMLEAERARIVRRVLREVPAPFRAAVVLKDLADLSYEEIGQALGCPLGTVESRIHRGRAILRARRILRS
jgi:RNA polymerase sigma-70 factor (ECF subfamily)